MKNIIGLFVVLVITAFASATAQTINQTNEFGKKEGKFVKRFDNNKIKYEGQFRNDIPYGKFLHYFNTGDIKAEVVFDDDGIIAYSNTYYKNGKKMAVGKFIQKQKDSVWVYYLNESGNPLISMESYVKGVLDGESITYYPDSGEPAEIITYVNGKKDGKLIKYFPDGVLMTESYYKNGMPHGDFLHYHPDGKIQIRGKYYEGVQAGNWDYFNEKGDPVSEEDFSKQEEIEEVK